MDLTREAILVTGGHGFLGRHVVGQLTERGCRDVAAPRSAEFDLTRPDRVAALFAEVRPTVVIHLAARVGGIEANRRHPGLFLHDNLLMGALLVEEARKAGVRRFVNVGTICSYPKHTPVPFREEDLWNGYPESTNAPYGIAKKTILAMLQAYQLEYAFPGVNLLMVNLYGPYDNFDPVASHVIPGLIRRFSEARDRGDEEVTCWGTGTPTREFLFVEDGARAVVLAAEQLDDPEPVNVGTGEEISIAELAGMVAHAVDYRGVIRFDPSRPDGQPRRCLDVSRARERLGFVAQVKLPAGLERTVGWYRTHPSS